MQKEILDRVDAIAAKLGSVSHDAWNILLVQARVELVFCCVFLLMGIGIGLSSIFLFRQASKSQDSEEGWFVVGSLVVVISIIMIGYNLCGINESVYPPYWAMKQVLATIGK